MLTVISLDTEPFIILGWLKNNEGPLGVVKTKSAESSVTEKLPPSERSSLYSEDGVDLSLIRWMLSLTPAERLQVLQQNVRSIMRLRSERTRT